MHRNKHSLEELYLVRKLLNENIFLIKIIDALIDHEQYLSKVHLALITTINNSKFQIMDLQINQGQFSVDSLSLIDTDTNQPISDATFANVSFASDNSAILTSVQDPSNPNQVTNTGIAPGSANVNLQADVTFVDSVSGQSVTKTLQATVAYTVVAAQGGSENVALQLIQGTPQSVVSQQPSPAQIRANATRGIL